MSLREIIVDAGHMGHKIVTSKEEWDYFHRILLLLESDGELEITRVRKWSYRQLIAACSLALFFPIALYSGWGEQLLAVSVPFGIVSILLYFGRRKTTPAIDPLDITLTPFSSISELLTARRRVLLFTKKRYPNHLKSRKIRNPISDKIMLIPSVLIWLIFAPIPLLFQVMPDTDRRMKVTMP